MQVEENFIKLDTGSAFQLAYSDSDWQLDDNRYIKQRNIPSQTHFQLNNIDDDADKIINFYFNDFIFP